MPTAGQESRAQGLPIPIWVTVLPIAFVVISLVALVLVPIFMGQRARELWVEIAEVAEPADLLVDRIEFALAREIAGMRGFLLTGESGFLVLYEQAVVDEMGAYGALEARARRLGPAVERRLEQVRALTLRWHAEAERLAAMEGRPEPAERVEAITVQQLLYREVLDATVALNVAIDQEVDQRRAEIRTAERDELLLTGVLGLLAVVAMLVVGRLGSRLYRITEQAEQNRIEVENLTNRRASLIRGLGHDLKNPLGAVDSYAEILETGIKGDLLPEQAQIIGRMRRATSASLSLINDLMEFSRAEAGQLRIQREPTDVQAIVRDAADERSAMLEEAGVELELEQAAKLPMIESDPDRVRQILANLLSNAAKYVPAGEKVIIRAAVRSGRRTPGGGDWIAVDVEDTGPGIPREEQQKIFEEFYRVEGAERQTSGSGLGLAISRRIARLLGGELTVQSKVGVGSTFTLWLPIEV